MPEDLRTKNAVAAIRVSTTKQGTDGDSPEAQKEQIERYAENKGISIKKFFVFLESASKEQQPMQEAIDYCKDPKNEVELFIIKSIDRFTRGGSLSYDLLKSQLEKCSVSLVDIYGVISSTQVNTLEHLGLEYKWSVYSPSKKSEILEAERSKDELRDIMSRMIGAEVRYTRMGYWMRQPPYGYMSEKIETINGKRTILTPHPEESKFIIKMFELRASGRYTDSEIAKMINDMGYRNRAKYTRDKNGLRRERIQLHQGKMNDKHLWRIVRSPIYAGVNVEKWTNGEPVKCAFDGLVSVELFNKANKGKRLIIEDRNRKIFIQDDEDAKEKHVQGRRNEEFSFRRYIMCPQCEKPMLGSASRGKGGKYYPAYHCDKRGHYFRVKKQDLDVAVDSFVKNLRISPERVELVYKAIEGSWERAEASYRTKVNTLSSRISDLQSEASVTVNKLKVLSSETAIKYMEEDLVRIEADIQKLEAKKAELTAKKPVIFSSVMARARYFVEHLDELLVKQIDPVKKAQFFGLLFSKAPTYEEIKSGTPQKGLLHPLLDIIKDPSITDESLMVTLIESNWNLICSEILRWVEILKGGQWPLALPA